jgi:hypothetical protein
MYAHFLPFQRDFQCEPATNGSKLAHYHSLTDEKFSIMADLLLNNCSVAIQHVFRGDDVPLPSSALKSISSAARSLGANPSPSDGPEGPRPATRVLGTASGTFIGGTVAANRNRPTAVRGTGKNL